MPSFARGAGSRPRLTARSAAVVCALFLACTTPVEQTARSLAAAPNIVLILADDLGYSDIGAYGGEIQTPHLDGLAEGGLRFSQFYNAGRCCPTRASLLTGRYPHEAGMGAMVTRQASEVTPGAYQGFLATEVPTLAETLRAAGYATYMSGKWHVGERSEHWPRARGFDEYFGLISGASSYWEIVREGNPMVRQMVDGDTPWEPPAEGFYMTDAFSERAVSFLQRHERERSDQPFFLYLAYTAPHWPLHAHEEDIARYAGRYDGGWEALRAERWERIRPLGLFPEDMAHTPRPDAVPAWEDVEDKARWARLMEIYAAMVDRMDQGIGQVLAQLEASDALENTLVLFLSDNGACAESVERRGLNDPEAELGARGSYVAYREPWAWASNTPLRLYKQWQHEGGIRTPLIASWPSGISRAGEIEPRVGHVIDLAATLADLAGVSSSELAGTSLAPLFAGQQTGERDGMLFWEHIGHRAVRDGRYKLAWERQLRRWELYDIEADPAETNDLVDAEPERVERMAASWDAWAQRVGVVLR